jgi:predicted dehydrogenase
LMGSNYQRVYTEVANFKGPANQVDVPHFYDNALVNIKFESGGLGLISGVCPCGYGYDARAEIIGEKGIMQIGELKGQAIVVCTDRDQGLLTPIFRTWPERFELAYVNELQHFVSCIQSGTPPRAGGLEGRWAVAGVLAGTKSFLEERPVYLKEILGEENSR